MSGELIGERGSSPGEGLQEDTRADACHARSEKRTLPSRALDDACHVISPLVRLKWSRKSEQELRGGRITFLSVTDTLAGL